MKSTKTKVSIIAPMYNVEEYLEKCIDSIVNQTLEEIEIILVDDGSPDNSGKIAEKYAKNDYRIKVIHKKNGGVSAARNDGLKIATGEYVLFCDADDWLDNKCCEVLYKNAKENNSDISIGDVYMAYPEKNTHIRFYANDFCIDKKVERKKLIKATINRTYCDNPPEEGVAFGYGGPWNKLVRRKLLTDNNIEFDVRTKGVFDDILYTAYILENAQIVSYISYPVYYYRQVETSITNSYKANMLEINSLIFVSWNEFFEKYEDNEEFQKPYYACIIRRISETLKLYYLTPQNPKSKKELQKEYYEMIKKNPYQKAIKNVEMNKLSRRQKLIVLLSRKPFIWLLWIILTRYYKNK